MVSFDPIFRCVADKVKDIPMIIKQERINAIEFLERDEFGDIKDEDLIKGIEFEEDDMEYDFLSDEIIQLKKYSKPYYIIPEEGLRYSIIDIFAYCVTHMVNDYMRRFTQNSNSFDPSRKCLIYMKNEFLFKTVLFMPVKKHYCSIQELQEGHRISNPRDGFDIKGMNINKSGLKDTTKDRLQDILFEEILNSDNIDQVAILKRLGLFEKEIFDNLNSGKKDYYKPARIKASTSYDDPMRIQGIKASVAFNNLCKDGVEKIDLTQRNSVEILKVNITPKNILHLKQDNPEVFDKLSTLMQDKNFSTGITAIAYLPDAIPENWVYEFIDYATIINDNLSSFPLEQIGIYKGNDSNSYTNIVSL